MKKKKSAFLTVAFALLYCTCISANSTGVRLAQIPESGGFITESGNYYLGYDVPDGALTIDADRVILNLNGHTVRNISISGHNDVIIRNGIVNASSLSGGSGISISSSDNVHLSDIAVLNAGNPGGNTNGIGVSSSSTNIFLSGLLVANSTSVGIRVSGGNNRGICISDCRFENNLEGVFISGGNGETNLEIEVKRCLATGNTTNGFFVGDNSQRIYFFDCIARDNGTSDPGNPGDGFQGSGSGSDPASFAVLRCLAEGNGRHGFNATDNLTFIFEGCTARNNTNDGFNANGQTNVGLMKECIALANTECGFDNQGVTTDAQPVSYVANYAAANSAEFCSSGAANGGFPYCTHTFENANAQFWRNIAGS